MDADRRDFIKAAGVAAFTTNIFTGNLKGANDRVNLAFIGMGKQGRGNLNTAMRQESVNIHSVCDVFDRNLKLAHDAATKKFPEAKAIKDFRGILGDKSVDAIFIGTPDHWHAYMTVEGCKAGKDVYVEKPVCVTVEEAKKMVDAARKYKRVVQAGTQQRSAEHFQKAVQLVKRGELGQVTAMKTWYVSNEKVEGIGNPGDAAAPPEGLDWDMWLGPAPARPFNANRFGVDPEDRYYSRFRYFWDYAGGMMTDWGVHLLDIGQMAFNEAMPVAVTALGGTYRVKDNRETPDTLLVTYEYPGFIGSFENRTSNTNAPFGKPYGTSFHGDKATLFVDRSMYQVFEEGQRGSSDGTTVKAVRGGGEHWTNFLNCIKTREKPNSDIETCARSTTTCLLANIAYRTKMRIDWDEQKWTVKQPEARKFLFREERKPWRVVV